MSIDAAYDWAVDTFMDPPECAGLEELPDTYFWKNILYNLNNDRLYEKLGLLPVRGILFSGDSGNGRHTLANALVTDIWKREGITDPEKVVYTRLRAEDFTAELSEKAAQERIDALFQAASHCLEAGETEFAFLVFDQIEQYAHTQILQNRIRDGLEEMEQEAFFLICITEKEEDISAELKSALLCCRCNSPGERARKEFLEENLSWEVPDWEYPDRDLYRQVSIEFSGISFEEIAERTEGFSYQNMQDFVFFLKMELVQKNLDAFTQAMTVIHLSKELVEAHLEAVRPAAKASAGNVIVQNAVSAGAAQAERGKGNRMKELSEKSVDDLTVEEQVEILRTV